MADPLRTLAKQMATSRTIGFVGAGYSARSGYPTWPQLIQRMYDRARQYAGGLPNPDEPGVDKRWLAEVYAKEITRWESLADVLVDSHRSDDDKGIELDRLQLLVARLPFNHFITTNYDGLLEQACNRIFEIENNREPVGFERATPRDGRVDEQFTDFLGSLADDNRLVLHLHGTFEGTQLTLSMGEYDRQYLHDAMLLRMFSIFATSTVVFIGASLYDADVMELLRRSRFHTNERCRHYAFLPGTRERDAEMLRDTFGVQPIFYDFSEDEPSDHSDLDRMMERLLEAYEACRRCDTKSATINARADDGVDVSQRVLPKSAKGNVSPVRADHGVEFDAEVERVKDHVRTAVRGPVMFVPLNKRGLAPNGVAGSRILRRIAADYQEIPRSYRFRHVVWISPGRIGLFPGERSRPVVDAVIGEIAYSLGRDRATATIDRRQNIHSIAKILGDTRWHPDHEPTLLVADGGEELRDSANEEREALKLASLLRELPRESLAIFEEPRAVLEHRIEKYGEWLDPDLEPPGWARDATYEAALDRLFEGAPDARTAEQRAADMERAEAEAEANGTRPPRSEADVALEKLHNERTVLVALCLIATPISSDQLTTILGMDRYKVEQTIDDLRAEGLIETPKAAGGPDVSSSVDIGLLNPIRWTTLKLLYRRRHEDPREVRCATDGVEEREPLDCNSVPKQVLVDVLATVLDWAETTMERLNRWEDDKEQLDELINHLPNLLAAFEAGCWVGTARAYQDATFANRRLWLGTDLAYLMYHVGRWAETRHMLEYLRTYLDENGHDASDPETLEREVMVLLTAFYAHAGRPESHHATADRLAEGAIELAEKAIERGTPEASGAVRYAPARLTPRRQQARARLWRSHALIRKLDNLDDAELADRLSPDEERRGAMSDEERAAVDAERDACSTMEADLLDILTQDFENDDDPARPVAPTGSEPAGLLQVQRRLIRLAAMDQDELTTVLGASPCSTNPDTESTECDMQYVDRGPLLEQLLDGNCEDDDDRKRHDESLRIVADTSLVLAEYRLLELRASRADQVWDGTESEEPTETDRPQWFVDTLGELDAGRAKSRLVRSRPRGYNARLRGEVLLEHFNRAAARRCFARVLLISHEFKDRYLEASALLGLARCDRQRVFAERAITIFDDLNRLPEQRKAQRWHPDPFLNGDDPSRLDEFPKLVVIAGVPGSGKSAAVAVASQALGDWGFDPVVAKFDPTLLEKLRDEAPGDRLDLAEIITQLEEDFEFGSENLGKDDTAADGGPAPSPRRVVIVKIPTGRLCDLFDNWKDEPVQMRSTLCMHLTASHVVLNKRNEQRRGGRLSDERLRKMVADQTRQAERHLDGATWETWFQCKQSAYVDIDATAPIIEFEERVRDALALSYLTVDQLIETSKHRSPDRRPRSVPGH